MTPLRLEAPAKLNLSLAVVGRRADGYHELLSEMVLLDLADRLLLMPGSSGLRVERLAQDAGEVPALAEQNLAWRGLVAALGGAPDLACLSLEKAIPAGSGLGGGSSDAAAAWRLGRQWRGLADQADDAMLARLASLGADVPFFAAGVAAARVEGIGERVTPLPTPEGGDHVLLVHPPFSLSTAAVFAELRPAEWSRDAVPGRNDLLAPARRLRPELDAILRLATAAGVAPQLTGSGPTVFARSD
ncbi:MAG TPA: 4-(cytidine 5'-diphospho)-2-C-methyl-D-erythritol kinase, partial [Candidatus Limnocylindria bacterium]